MQLLGPDRPIVLDIDQLRGDAHAIARSPNAAFHDIADIEPAADNLTILIGSAKLKRRGAWPNDEICAVRESV